MRISTETNNELSFIDLLSIISFLVGLQNLELNVSASDINEQTQDLNKSLKRVVDDIHNHLSVQDAKLNIILNKLEDKYDKNQEVSKRDEG